MTAAAKDAPARLKPAREAFRTLIVHVQPEAAAAPRLATATALARALDATLIGVAAEMLQTIGVSDPYGLVEGEFLVEARAQIQRNFKKSEAAFREQAKGLTVEWLAVEEFPGRAVCDVSRSADLIIAGGSPGAYRDGYRWCDPAELALKSGRPVLVAPPRGGELKAEAVLVAWKDTREARRAVADAMPLLKSAKDVLVMRVCEAADVGDAEYQTHAVVQSLKRHGVAARAKVAVAPNLQVAAELNAEAGAMGADLIVSGAYGHTRLGEWVFGGVTRDFLGGNERFLLLSH